MKFSPRQTRHLLITLKEESIIANRGMIAFFLQYCSKKQKNSKKVVFCENTGPKGTCMKKSYQKERAHKKAA